MPDANAGICHFQVFLLSSKYSSFLPTPDFNDLLWVYISTSFNVSTYLVVVVVVVCGRGGGGNGLYTKARN
jgi:hypothetical protein